MEAHGPAVVPEAPPAADDLRHGCRRTGRRRREGGQERPVVRHHPIHAGLLGHDLGDQHGPRVAGRPPRQGPQVALAPVDQPGQWYTRVTYGKGKRSRPASAGWVRARLRMRSSTSALWSAGSVPTTLTDSARATSSSGSQGWSQAWVHSVTGPNPPAAATRPG